MVLESTHIRLPDDVKRAARVKAIQQGTNLSEVIRKLLALYVDGKVPELEDEVPTPEAPC